MEFNHVSVLLNESIDSLNLRPTGVYVDATLGGAGHSKKILERLDEKGDGKLYCFDKDYEAINHAYRVLSEIGSNFKLIHSDFSNLRKKLLDEGVEKIDGILFDIGVSSYQFDNPDRGFSYRFDAKLDMRMDQTQKLDAYGVVNTYSQAELSRIFYEYGEEKFSRQISAKIVEERKKKPICTTFELVDVIKKALPAYVLNQKGHPAKQVFQAIRIEVNDELGALKSALSQALSLLKQGGRCAVITFHSLEDRIVKNMFRDACCCNDNVKGMASLNRNEQLFRLVNRKPIISNEQELSANNRAHSAKLRVIEKL